MDLRALLIETHAHIPPAHALEDLSEQNAISRLPNVAHSIADIVGHMDFWQTWFLMRCRGENAPFVSAASLGWPTVAEGGWTAVRDQFIAGTEVAAELGSHPDVLDRRLNPAIEFPPLEGFTIRDALIHVASHNSHHLGQIITLRQLSGCWPPAAGSWTW
jgi:uncharacterized damage-inducible protein DinB